MNLPDDPIDDVFWPLWILVDELHPGDVDRRVVVFRNGGVHDPALEDNVRAVSERQLEVVNGADRKRDRRVKVQAAEADVSDRHGDVEGDDLPVQLPEYLNSRRSATIVAHVNC